MGARLHGGLRADHPCTVLEAEAIERADHEPRNQSNERCKVPRMLLKFRVVEEGKKLNSVIDWEGKVEQPRDDVGTKKQVDFRRPQIVPQALPRRTVQEDVRYNPRGLQPFTDQQQRHETILGFPRIRTEHQVTQTDHPKQNNDGENRNER